MGEYADAVIEGCMCEWCGVFLKGSPGYPRLCADCAEGLPEEQWRVAEELINRGREDLENG